LQKAEEWAKKLLDLNPDSSREYFLSGLIQWKLGYWKDGIGQLRKSLTVDPSNPRSLEFLVYLYAIAGKGSVSRALLPKLLESDPLTPLFQGFPGWIEYMEGHFEAALVSIRKMYQMESENPFYSLVYANFLTRIQSLEEAFSVIDSLAEKAPQTSFEWLGLFRKVALQGRREKALELVKPEFTNIGKWDEQMSWEIAASFALIEENDKALNWLTNAIDGGFINYPFLNETDPFLENIRGEPRFKKLMERVKHEWENFEV
jgi:tetratricopeptide (TPR) repeat protein